MNKPCKFGEFCSFEHNIDNLGTGPRPKNNKEKSIEDKIQELKL